MGKGDFGFGYGESGKIYRIDMILDPDMKRYVHLDLMRSFCVLIVAVDHGYNEFSRHNVLFGPNWVLQLLWIICGISWSLSPKSLCQTFPRVAAYFTIGVFCNWIGHVIKGMDWLHDPFNVVYQFWFMVGLGVYLILTAPLRPLLKRNRLSPLTTAGLSSDRVGEAGEHWLATGNPDDFGVSLQPTGAQSVASFPDMHTSSVDSDKLQSAKSAEKSLSREDEIGLAVFCSVVVGQLMLLTVAWIFVSSIKSHVFRDIFSFASFWIEDTEDRYVIGQVLVTAGLYWIACVGARNLRSPRLAPWLAWVLILYSYGCRLLILPLLFGNFGGGVSRFFIGFELFVIGLTSASTGMRYAELCRTFVVMTWMFLFLFCGLIWDPTWDIRWDEHPPNDIFTMLRVLTVEAAFVVMFLVAGDAMFNHDLWSKQTFHMEWLSNFGLLLFLLHKAVHIVFKPHWNWVILYGPLPLLTILITWAVYQHRDRSPQKASAV